MKESLDKIFTEVQVVRFKDSKTCWLFKCGDEITYNSFKQTKKRFIENSTMKKSYIFFLIFGMQHDFCFSFVMPLFD